MWLLQVLPGSRSAAASGAIPQQEPPGQSCKEQRMSTVRMGCCWAKLAAWHPCIKVEAARAAAAPSGGTRGPSGRQRALSSQLAAQGPGAGLACEHAIYIF